MLTRILLCSALLAASCFADSNFITIAHVDDRPKTHVSKVWVASCLTLLAATSVDMASSWGRYEANPMLRSSDGRFGAKGVSMKLLFAGATLTPQYLLRHKQGSQKLFTIANFLQTGLYTGVAIRNYGVPRPPVATK
jgi:hypothetical protein